MSSIIAVSTIGVVALIAVAVPVYKRLAKGTPKPQSLPGLEIVRDAGQLLDAMMVDEKPDFMGGFALDQARVGFKRVPAEFARFREDFLNELMDQLGTGIVRDENTGDMLDAPTLQTWKMRLRAIALKALDECLMSMLFLVHCQSSESDARAIAREIEPNLAFDEFKQSVLWMSATSEARIMVARLLLRMHFQDSRPNDYFYAYEGVMLRLHRNLFKGALARSRGRDDLHAEFHQMWKQLQKQVWHDAVTVGIDKDYSVAIAECRDQESADVEHETATRDHNEQAQSVRQE